MLIRQGRLDEAEELLEGVLHEAQVSADAERISEAFEGLGLVALDARRLRRGRACCTRRPASARADADPGERIDALRRPDRDLPAAPATPPGRMAVLEDCLARLRRSPVADPAKFVRYSLWLSRAYAEAGDHGPGRRRRWPTRCATATAASTCRAAPRPRSSSRALHAAERPHRTGASGTPTARSRCTSWPRTTRPCATLTWRTPRRLLDASDADGRRRAPGGRPRALGPTPARRARRTRRRGGPAGAALGRRPRPAAAGRRRGGAAARRPTPSGSATPTWCWPVCRTRWARSSGRSTRTPRRSRRFDGGGRPARASAAAYRWLRQVPEAPGPRRGGAGGVRAGGRPGAVDARLAGAGARSHPHAVRPLHESPRALDRHASAVSMHVWGRCSSAAAGGRRTPDRARAIRRGRGAAGAGSCATPPRRGDRTAPAWPGGARPDRDPPRPEQHALDLLRESLEAADEPDPAERTGLYFELARLLAQHRRRRRRRGPAGSRSSSGCPRHPDDLADDRALRRDA